MFASLFEDLALAGVIDSSYPSLAGVIRFNQVAFSISALREGTVTRISLLLIGQVSDK